MLAASVLSWNYPRSIMVGVRESIPNISKSARHLESTYPRSLLHQTIPSKRRRSGAVMRRCYNNLKSMARGNPVYIH